VTIGGGNLESNLLLWIGLTLIAVSLLLAFAGNVYAWRMMATSAPARVRRGADRRPTARGASGASARLCDPFV
jgi:hypothetical protein